MILVLATAVLIFAVSLSAGNTVVKIECLCVVLAFAVGLVAAVTDDPLEAPRPLQDQFRILQTSLTESKLETEINDFTSYSCQRMVVISNEASDYFPIWCYSRDDQFGYIHVYPGESIAFTFRPRANGQFVYQCTLDYKTKWATFDVYNDEEWYTCSRDNSMVYRYYIRHDGVYANKHKIRALYKGHDEYTLWERYDEDTKETEGLLMTGYVDGGMCANVPLPMNDRASAVTVCDHQCVVLYEHYRCIGESKKFQATEGCIDFHLEELDKIVSAVKGC